MTSQPNPEPSLPLVSGTAHLDQRIQRALARPHRIDITTTGRRTGRPRRIELVFHVIDGKVVISGSPGRRDWYANLVADPHFTFHLKGPVQADLPAIARPITEPVERRQVMEAVARNWGVTDRFEVFFGRSPLIEVRFDKAA
ncbi:MAG TPA: nitroreductase/quinone reductase family protein [Candidatus Limnocylindria bacterium]|jgi:deazaflavin-dependent oxidoreductase (nitroreductase family)